MKFILEIEVSGSAFDPTDTVVGKPPEKEVARILRKYADRLEDEGRLLPNVLDYWPLLDINGNTVGVARFVEEE